MVSERKNDVNMQHSSLLCKKIELLYQREHNSPGVGVVGLPQAIAVLFKYLDGC